MALDSNPLTEGKRPVMGCPILWRRRLAGVLLLPHTKTAGETPAPQEAHIARIRRSCGFRLNME